MIKGNKVLNIMSLLLIWGIMIMGFPFSIAQAFHFPSKIIMAISISILLVIIILNIKRVKVYSTVSFIFILQITTALLFFIIHKDFAYINLLFQILVPYILFIYVVSFLKIELISESIVKLVMFMGLMSVIIFFLGLIFNVNYYSVFENPDGRQGYNYIIAFTNSYTDFGFTKFIRPAGFFDEPGSLAYYIILSILINDLTLRKNSVRYFLFIVGIFTTSIAFYLLMIVYGIIHMKKKQSFLVLIYVFSFLILLFSIFSLLEPEQQEIIYGSSVGRLLSIISPSSIPNHFQADNRSDLISIAKEAIYDSPLIGQGISYASNQSSKFYGTFMGANILGIFGVHGVIGGLIFSLHVVYYTFVSFFNKNESAICKKSCLLFLLLLIQRPDYIGGVIPYFSVLVLTILSKDYKDVSKNFNCNSCL
jgi:hypothetical protein